MGTMRVPLPPEGTMTYTTTDDTGTRRHTCRGLRRMRELVWNLAASGVQVTIEED